jgi:hypothetical protein
MTNDTRRWLDTDLPDELQAVLSSAREDHARPAQVANLRANLEHAIGPAAFNLRAPNGSPTAASAGSGETLATKLFGASHSWLGPAVWSIGSIVALGLVATTARVVWSPHESGRRSATSVSTAAPGSASTLDPSSQPTAAATPTPRVQGVAPAARAPEPANQALGAAPARAAASSARSRARSRGTLRAREQLANTAQAAPNPRAQDTLAEELRSLDRIRSEMRDPARALAAAERHAKRFPAGALVPERELLQLEALLRAGQTVRARGLVTRLTSPSVQHPYRAQALQLLSEYGVAAPNQNR